MKTEKERGSGTVNKTHCKADCEFLKESHCIVFTIALSTILLDFEALRIISKETN